LQRKTNKLSINRVLKNRFSKALAIFLIYMIGGFPTLVFALPQDGQIVSGQGTVGQPSPNQMVINQNTNQLITNWNSFSIGQSEHVQFNQPNVNSTALNRVMGQDPSAIMGRLSANGQVFLSNPSGVVFGQNSRVNVGGLMATTLGISNDDFLNRNYHFKQDESKPLAAILNQGTIEAGQVGLLAPRVENQGTIIANLGNAVLSSGEAAIMDFDGSGLINFEITQPVNGEVKDADGNVVESGVVNSGFVKAHSGNVILSASQARGMVRSVVNNTGIIEANNVVKKGGRVFLMGNRVKNSGTINVTGKEPGQTGGTVHILGNEVEVSGGTIDASGDAGGGTVLIGGDKQGQNPNIQNATNTTVAESATIKADAINKGDGGKVIIWSENSTKVYAAISARGGANGGDGGFVETSGKKFLDVTKAADVSAPKGKAGTWLLDPTNIEIVSGPGNGDGSQISVTTIETALNAGTSVHIVTSGQGLEEGNITVSTAILKSSGGDTSLTLTAHGDIVVNQSITSTNGTLDVNLIAGADILINAAIATNGGNLLADAGATNLPVNISGSYTPAARICGAAVELPEIQVNADITTNGGNVNLGQFKTKSHSLIGGGTYTKEKHATADVTVQNASVNTNGGDFTINGSAATVASTATITTPGGNIVIEGSDQSIVSVSGILNAANAAASQTGGNIHVLGYKVGIFGNAELDASGDAGGGIILIGGDYQGKNDEIQNAYRTYVGTDAVIKADATNTGNGGKVIVWADDVTRFYGTITAKGGATSGDGGLVETSGKNFLDAQGFVDTTAANGNTGLWLLDPQNVVIDGSGGAALTDVDQFADGSGTVNINASTINAAASNVTIQANDDITVSTAINMTNAGITLTLQAGDDVFINANITTNDAAIVITANAAGHTPVAHDGTGDITESGDVTVDAGNATITLSAEGDILLPQLTTTSTSDSAITVTSTAGSILDGTAGIELTATSGGAVLSAATGIGTAGASGAVDMNVVKINATNTTSGVITIGENASGGSLEITGITAGGSTSETLVFVQNATADITISGNLNAVGTVIIQAPRDIILNASNNITLATNGSLVMQAGDDITLNSSIAASGTGTLHFEADSGHTDAGAANGTGGMTLASGQSLTTVNRQITLILDGSSGAFTGSTINSGSGNINVANSVDNVATGIGVTDFNDGFFDLITTTGTLTVGQATTAGSDGLGTSAVVLDAGAVTVTGISNTTASNFTIASTSTVTFATTTSSFSGNLSVNATGAVAVNVTASSLNGVSITSSGAVTVASAAQVLANDDGGADTLSIQGTSISLTPNGSVYSVEQQGTGTITLTSTSGVIDLDTAGTNGISIKSQDQATSNITGLLTLNAATNITGANSANQEIFSNGSVTFSGNNIGAGTGNNAISIASSFTAGAANTLTVNVNGTASSAFVQTHSADNPFDTINITLADDRSAFSYVTNPAAGGDSITGLDGTTKHDLSFDMSDTNIDVSYTITEAAAKMDIHLGSGAGSGAITLTADDIDITANLGVSGGSVILKPNDTTRSIGIGGGAGDFNLTDTDIGFIIDGQTSITIGASGGTGAVAIDSATFTDPITIRGGTMTLSNVGITATGNNVTLTSTGLIGDGGGNDTTDDILGSTLTLTSSGAIGSTINNALNINVGTLIITGTGNSNVFITEATSLSIGTLNAGAGSVELQSAGSISSSSSAITANNLNLLVGGSGAAIGASGTAINTTLSGTLTLTASVGTGGGIFISNTGTLALGVINAGSTSGDTVEISSTTGMTNSSSSITAENLTLTVSGSGAAIGASGTANDINVTLAGTLTATASTGAGGIFVGETGDMLVGAVNSGTGNMEFTTTGAWDNTSALTVTGAALTITADTGVGLNESITTTGVVIIDADSGNEGDGDFDIATTKTLNSGGNSMSITASEFILTGTGAVNSGAGNMNLFQSSATTISVGSATGTFNITDTEIASITTTGTLTIGDSSLASAITIDTADFSAKNVALQTNSTISDANDTGANLTTSGTLTLTSNGVIGATTTQGINIDVASVTVTSSGGNNVILRDNGATATTLTVTTGGAGNLEFVKSGAGNIVIGGVSTTGNITNIEASNGTITQTGALTVTGTASFDTSSASNTITLTNASNAVQGAISFTTIGAGSNVTFDNNTTGVIMGTSGITGNLSVTTGGTITDTGVTTVSGSASFTTDVADQAITLNSANAITGTITFDTSGTGGDVTIDNGSTAIDLAAHASGAIGGDLIATTTGTFTVSNAITLSGGSLSLTAGSDLIVSANLVTNTIITNNITLTSDDRVTINDFALSAQGNLTLEGDADNAADTNDDLVIGTSSTLFAFNGSITLDATTGGISGTDATDLNLQAGDNITINDAVSVTSSGASFIAYAGDNVNVNANITTTNGAVDLEGNRASFYEGTGGGSPTENVTQGSVIMADGAVINSGTAVQTLSGQGDITVGRLVTTNSSTAAITLTSSAGGIVDAGDTGGVDIETTGGTLVIDAVTGVGTAGAIETTIALLDLDNTTSGNVLITETNGIDITKITQNGGNLTLTSTGGSITDTGINTVSGTSSFITSTAGQSITLDSVNVLSGAVSLTTSGTGDATLDNGTTALILGTVSIGQNLVVTAGNAITDSGVITVGGTASFTTDVNDQAITLDSTNAITGAVSFTTQTVGGNTGNVTLDNGSTALDLGTLSIAGSFSGTTTSSIGTSGTTTTATGLTLNANTGIDLSNNVTGAGATVIDSDVDNNGVGDFTISASAALSSTGNTISITGNDIILSTSAGTAINSGAAATTLLVSDGGTIGLGGTAGNWTLDGAELEQITATGLTIGDATNGNITVNGITAANSNNVSGTLTLNATAAGGTVTFDTTASIFNALTVNAENGINVNAALSTDTGALTFDADSDNDAGGTFTVASSTAVATSNSAINVTAAIFTLTDGTSTLNSGSGNVSLLQSSAVTVSVGTNTGTFDVDDTELGAITTTGTLTIGDSTLASAITVDTVAGGAKNFALETSSTIDDASDAGSHLTTTGTLSLTSGGAIGSGNAQGLNVDVASVTVTSSGGNNVTITDQGTSDTTFSIATGGAGTVTLIQSASNMILGTTSTTGSLSATSTAGTITDTGVLTAGGTASFITSANDQAITLDSANMLSGAISFTTNTAGGNTGNVSLTNNTATNLGASTIDGSFTVSSNGAISDSGNQTVASTASFTTSGNDQTISLNNTNAITGAVSFTTNTAGGNTGDVTIDNGTTNLILAASTIRGDLFATSGGTITQSGALTVTATSSFTTDVAGQSITLSNTSNALAGAVSLSTTGVGDATLDNGTTALILGTVGIGQNLAVTAGNAITDTGVITVGGTASFTTDVADNAITLDSTNAITGAVSFTTTGTGGDVTLDNGATALNMGTISTGGFFSGTTTGAITTSGTTTTGEGLTLNANAGITLSQNVTSAGATVIDADVDNNGAGDFTVSSSAALSSTGNTISITANDIDLSTSASAAINSGAAATTLLISDNGTIGLGGTAANWTLDGSELEKITATGLNIGDNNDGAITVNGITAANSNNIAGTLSLNTGGTAQFTLGDSTFNALSVSAVSGVLLTRNVTTDAGSATFNADSDADGTGDFQITSGDALNSSGNAIQITSNDITVSGTINSGAAATTLLVSDSGTIGLGATAGNWTLDDAELGRITATGLNIGDTNDGNATINGITAANSANISGTLKVNTGGSATFATGISIFNALAVDANNGITTSVDVATDTGGMIFNADKDNDGTGSFTLGTDNDLETIDSDIEITAADFILDTADNDAAIVAGSGTVTIKSSNNRTIGLGVTAGNMTISGDEMAKINASALVIGESSSTGTITVDGITQAQSDNIAGTTTLLANAAITFQNTNEFFNNVTAQGSSVTTTGTLTTTQKSGNLILGVGDTIKGDNTGTFSVTVNVNGSDVLTNFTFSSTAAWVDTGVAISAGDTIVITATGTVDLDGAAAGIDPNGPGGGNQLNNNGILNDGVNTQANHTPLGALIGKIGGTGTADDGTGFYVGSSYSSTGNVTLTSTSGNVSMGAINSAGNISASATSGTITDTGVLTALGTGSFTTNTADQLITLDSSNAITGAVAFTTTGTGGDVTFNNGGTAINMGTISTGGFFSGTTTSTISTSGTTTTGEGLTLSSLTNITLNNNVTAGGAVVIDPDSNDTGLGSFTIASGQTLSTAAANATISITGVSIDINGNIASGSGNITITPSQAGTSIGLGGGAGTISITDAELDRISTTGTLTIGDATNTTTVTVDGVTNSTASAFSIIANDTGGSGITFSGTASTFGGALTLSNPGSININANVTTAGTTTITADNEGNSSGDLQIGAGATLATGGNSLAITADDFGINATGAINTGAGAITIKHSANGLINLGATASADMTISGADLENITTTSSLTIGDSSHGDMIVNGISAANSNNVTGTLTLTTGGSVTFSTGASTFNALTVSAANEIINNVAVTTDTGDLSLSSTGDNFDVFIQGALTSAGATTINAAEAVFFSAAGSITGTGSGAVTLNANTDNLDGDNNPAAGDTVFMTTGSSINAGSGTITITATGANANAMTLETVTTTNTSGSAITINSRDGLTLNGNVTASGTVAIDADVNDDGTGDFTIAASQTLNTNGNALSITANDVTITGNINSGSAATTFLVSDSGTIGLGATPGNWTLDGAELERITATGLNIGDNTDGNLTIDGISAANSNNISGTVALNTGGSASFDTADSTFNALAVNAVNGITLNRSVTTDTGSAAFNSDSDANGTGDFTIAASQTLTTNSNGLSITANDITLTGSIDAGASGNINLLISDSGTIGIGATAGNWTLDGAELQNITANTMTIGDTNDGAVTIDGITNANSQNITTTLLINSGGLATVSSASTFNVISIDAIGGITVSGDLTSDTGDMTLDANTGTLTVAGQALNATGGSSSVTLTADAIDLQAGSSFTGSDTFTLQASTAGTTIGIGSGSTGTVNLTDTEVGFITAAGFSSVVIGASGATGAIDFNTTTIAKNLTVRGGAFDNSSGLSSVTGSFSAELTATSTISALTSTSTISIDMAGNAQVLNLGGALMASAAVTLTSDDDITFTVETADITSTTGGVTLTADSDANSDAGSGGAINMIDNGTDGIIIDAGDGDIALSADENILLGRLVTTSSSDTAVVLTTASGSIDDVGDSGSPDITATTGRLVIDAVTGIGNDGSKGTNAADDAIDTEVASYDIDNSTSGNINLIETDGVDLIKVAHAGTGNIVISAGGDVTNPSNATITTGTATVDGNIVDDSTVVEETPTADAAIGTPTPTPTAPSIIASNIETATSAEVLTALDTVVVPEGGSVPLTDDPAGPAVIVDENGNTDIVANPDDPGAISGKQFLEENPGATIADLVKAEEDKAQGEQASFASDFSDNGGSGDGGGC